MPIYLSVSSKSYLRSGAIYLFITASLMPCSVLGTQYAHNRKALELTTQLLDYHPRRACLKILVLFEITRQQVRLSGQLSIAGVPFTHILDMRTIERELTIELRL